MDRGENSGRVSQVRANCAFPVESGFRLDKGAPRWKGALFCLVLLLLHAIDAGGGMVYGVISCDREVLQQKNVTLENPEGEKTRIGTDSNGSYSISLPPGEYLVIYKGPNGTDCVGWLNSAPNAVRKDVELRKVSKKR